MIELFKVNMAVIRKKKSLWVVLGIFNVVVCLLLWGYVADAGNKSFMFSAGLLSNAADYDIVSVCFAVFFLGREYIQGTIKNRVISGHTRLEIFLSYYAAVCVIFFIWFGSMFFMGFVGSLMLGFFYTLKECVLHMVLCLVSGMVTAALLMIIFAMVNSGSFCILTGVIVAIVMVAIGTEMTEYVGSLSTEISSDGAGNLVVNDGETALERGSIDRRITEIAYFTLPVVSAIGVSDTWGYNMLVSHLNNGAEIVLIDCLWIAVLMTIGVLIFKYKKVR